jgi:DNA-binding MarR family transcriptional regulator
MENEQIKNAFKRVKEDIDNLYLWILEIKKEIEMLKKEIFKIKRTFLILEKIQHKSNTSPTHEKPIEKFEGIKPYFQSSTGNEGVPTLLRQSYAPPTSNPTQLTELFDDKIEETLEKYKSEFYKRFKNLTNKEFEIFSLIYVLQEQTEVTYKLLAEKTGLAPSSVRDLVNRLILKGIPIQKIKKLNREVILKIPDELKKISDLEALSKLVNYYK